LFVVRFELSKKFLINNIALLSFRKTEEGKKKERATILLDEED
jgi:hypothetical protein